MKKIIRAMSAILVAGFAASCTGGCGHQPSLEPIWKEYEVKELPLREEIILVSGNHKLIYDFDDPVFKIMEKRQPTANGFLAMAPGGYDGSAGFLDPDNIEKVTITEEGYQTILCISGKLSYCTYDCLVITNSCYPGAFQTRTNVLLTSELKTNAEEFSNMKPDLALIKDGVPAVAKANFYFENDVPLEPVNHNWRYDLNQLIYFGEKDILNSSVMYYADFTEMNSYYEQSGTAIFQSIIAWDSHSDNVMVPPGMLGRNTDAPFIFGLKNQSNQQVLEKNQSFTISSGILSLESGILSDKSPEKTATAFFRHYNRLFGMVKKPEVPEIDWVQYTYKLFDELKERKEGAAAVFGNTAELNFSVNSYTRFFDWYDYEDDELFFKGAAINKIMEHDKPDYSNDKGTTGGFGWYNKKSEWDKVDFWQGYLWPIVQALEYSIRRENLEMQQMMVERTAVLIDTAQNCDYTFTVFVNVNSGQRDANGNEADYGAAAGYVYAMMLCYQITGDGIYLEEARKAADKLCEFGYFVGFETNVTSAGAYGLLLLYEETKDEKYLECSYLQIAVILKNTWLFRPAYERFSNRELFGLTSARANLNYANSAEEGSILRYFTYYLLLGKDYVDPVLQHLMAEIMMYKAVSCQDALPVLQKNKDLIETNPVNWDAIVPNSYVPVEPFGYCPDNMKLGGLNECTYGTSMHAELAMMLYYPVENGSIYSQAPVIIEPLPDEGKESYSLEALGLPNEFIVRIPAGYDFFQQDGIAVQSVASDTKEDLSGKKYQRKEYVVQPDMVYTVKAK